MNNVVTLVTDKEKAPLDNMEVGSVVDALQAHGGIIEDVIWLAEEEAVDIFFAVLDVDDACEMLTQLLANVPFDFVVQKNTSRKKKLLICDMDSTIIEQECIDELADFIGKKKEIAAITERAMNGELVFEDALKERVTMLEGLDESVLQEAFDKKITFMPGAKELVTTMKQNGARAVLVSGGFTFFTSRVQQKIGFDFEEANILEIKNGKLTGKVKEPILGKEAKFNALRFHADDLGINPFMALAVGDGANDLPMLQSAGLGVAYHAKPNVKAAAKAQIDTCDLKSLLYVQGYEEKDITTVS